jgi:hypothetical protein
MSIQEDGTYDEEAARRSRRRKQAVVGVVGVAAVLGGGAFFVTQAMTAKQAIAPDAALAPMAPETTEPGSPPANPRSSAATSRAPAARVSRTPSPSASLSAADRIKAARDKAAKDGVAVQRPLPAANAQMVVPDLAVTDSGSLKRDRGTLRVVSARGDLTGYGELAWVAGNGQPVGAATCSQTFKFANNAKPAKKPNLLICWQTSARKSVYTVMVNLDGHPSKKDSVAALAKRWSTMG